MDNQFPLVANLKIFGQTLANEGVHVYEQSHLLVRSFIGFFSWEPTNIVHSQLRMKMIHVFSFRFISWKFTASFVWEWLFLLLKQKFFDWMNRYLLYHTLLRVAIKIDFFAFYVFVLWGGWGWVIEIEIIETAFIQL